MEKEKTPLVVAIMFSLQCLTELPALCLDQNLVWIWCAFSDILNLVELQLWISSLVLSSALPYANGYTVFWVWYCRFWHETYKDELKLIELLTLLLTNIKKICCFGRGRGVWGDFAYLLLGRVWKPLLQFLQSPSTFTFHSQHKTVHLSHSVVLAIVLQVLQLPDYIWNRVTSIISLSFLLSVCDPGVFQVF